MQPASGLQSALGVAEELGVKDAPLLVTLFPPRVGKVNVDGGERTIGKQLVEYSQSVAVNKDGVVEAAPGEAGRSIASVLERQLDPQKVAVLVRCGRADEEQTFAAAHFNFERRFAFEQAVHVPGSRKIVELPVVSERGRVWDRACEEVGVPCNAHHQRSAGQRWSRSYGSGSATRGCLGCGMILFRSGMAIAPATNPPICAKTPLPR